VKRLPWQIYLALSLSGAAVIAVVLVLPREARPPADSPGTVSTRPAASQPSFEGLPEHERYWPNWRGPENTGVAPHALPPLVWSETQNIRWKIALPGKGHATPIIWRDRVFVTTAVPYGQAQRPPERAGAHHNLEAIRPQKFSMLAIRRSDGKILWQTILQPKLPPEGGHSTGSFASHSPVTDGKLLFASFGSSGIYCLDLDGRVKWAVQLGRMRTKHGHGEGSSPALHGDTLVVNWDHEGQSFLVALNKHTGAERWKVSRDEGTSWSTPLILSSEGKPQVVVSATRAIRAYDLATGAVVWQCQGLSRNVVASPVATAQMLFAGSSYVRKLMLAIRYVGAKGDISGTQRIVWRQTRHTPYVPSPLLYEGKLYYLSHYQGRLTCLEASTGAVLYGARRLRGIRNVYASLAGAAGRVYIVSRDGATLVLEHGRTPRRLALNQLDDRFSASPAFVDGELYLRGERYLYCIAEADERRR